MIPSKLAAAQLRHTIRVEIYYQKQEPRPVRLRVPGECVRAFNGRKVV